MSASEIGSHAHGQTRDVGQLTSRLKNDQGRPWYRTNNSGSGRKKKRKSKGKLKKKKVERRKKSLKPMKEWE